MFAEPRTAVFDVETNGLLDDLKFVWCIAFRDLEEKRTYLYADDVSKLDQDKYPVSGTLEQGVTHLSMYSKVVCHNVLGFDFFVLKRMYPKQFNLKPSQCWDTLIQSKMQWFDRPRMKGYKGVHGLAVWGARVGIGKPEVEDFTIGMCDLMAERIIEDVRINTKTYYRLNQERALLESVGIDMTIGFKVEHEYRFNATLQELKGAKFDVERGKEAVEEFTKSTDELAEAIEPNIPMYYEKESPNCTWIECLTAMGVLDKDIDRVFPSMKEQYQPNTVEYNNVLKSLQKVITKPEGAMLKKLGFNLKNLVTNTEFRTRKGVVKEYELKPTVKPVTAITILNGNYNANVCKYWDVEPEDAKKDRMIAGYYSKVSWHKTTLSQHDRVKSFLKTQGWIPTEFNLHKIKGETVKDKNNRFIEKNGETWYTKEGQAIKTAWSPKLTEDSYDSITGELGIQISHYNTDMHRLRFLDNPNNEEKGLLNLLRKDGRLSCGVQNFNTATGRASHTKWVNAPSADARGGKAIRECIIADEGRVLVSTDMNSAQLSIAAYYSNNYDYFKAVVDGNETTKDGCWIDEEGKEHQRYLGEDGHTFNAKAFGLISVDDWENARSMTAKEFALNPIAKVLGKGRKQSKGCTFATIFGAAGSKLAKMVGVPDKIGQQMKEDFLAKIGLDEVLKAVAPSFEYIRPKSGKGRPKRTEVTPEDAMPRIYKSPFKGAKGWYIEIPFGYFVYCDSPHKAINYLIQGTEAACQKIAINWMNRQVRKEKLDAFVILDYHDELTMDSAIECAERAGQIQEEGYRYASDVMFKWHNEFSKFFPNRGFAIQLDSPHQKGYNYAEIH